MKKRLLSLLISLALCAGLLPVSALARETDFFDPLPEAFDFAALRFDSSCISDTESICAAAQAQLRRGANPDALCALFFQITLLRTEMQTQLALVNILYHQDPDAYADAFSDMHARASEADRTALLTLRKLLNDPTCGALLRACAESSLLTRIEQESVPTQEQLELEKQETALVMEYQRAEAQERSVLIDGQRRTLSGAQAAYRAGELTRQEYLETLHALYALRADELGDIFLRLVALRKEIAQSRGFASYPDYAYAKIYHRDYTSADASLFREAVKAELVPLLRTLREAQRFGLFADGQQFDGCDESTLLGAIAPCLPGISDELAEAFAYMRDCDLIDAEYSEKKLPASFTSFLSGVGAPYVLCKRHGGNGDLETLVHEFGHFSAFCYGVRSGSYDAFEVHSQGLEALFLSYAESLYGGEARNQLGHALSEFLYLAAAGCCWDELQSYAYATPELSVDALNCKSAELTAAYGLTPLGPAGLDYSWVDITHSFTSPLYYISYATSAIAAMELYLRSQTDGLATAADCYLDFVSLCVEDGEGFRGVMQESGLGDPFSPDFIRSLTIRYASCLDEQVYALPFADISEHAAKGDITLLYLLGVMQGTAPACFSPDAPVSRAAAVTALHRILGCPESYTDAAAIFSDVAPDAWYAPAVGWAAKAGITFGTAAGSFSPDGILSCQDFSIMLYRAFCGGTRRESGEAPAESPVQTPDAVNWIRDRAIFIDAHGGALSPDAPLTRAELARALAGLLRTF
ncbi:MAG: S-layer homology domain-containing protein [Oscillospiraceae bacterium]|nr:S-layer homology domain-containing protein [Oscillospiraceae bacterium]